MGVNDAKWVVHFTDDYPIDSVSASQFRIDGPFVVLERYEDGMEKHKNPPTEPFMAVKDEYVVDIVHSDEIYTDDDG